MTEQAIVSDTTRDKLKEAPKLTLPDAQKVTSVQEFREAVQSLPEGKAVSVRVVRQGRALYLVMKP